MNIDWKDLQLTPEQYLDICKDVAKKSDFFSDWESSTWHPEDLYYNMSTITETVGQTFIAYFNLVTKRLSTKEFVYSPDAKTVEDMTIQSTFKKWSDSRSANPDRVQAAGDSNSELSQKTYSSNNIFGDNV